MDIIQSAMEMGLNQLTEHLAKEFLKGFGLPVTREFRVTSLEEAKACSKELGMPLVLKVDSPKIAHKTEKGLVITNVASQEALEQAFQELQNKHPLQEDEAILVQEMVEGKRELAMGLIRDPQFGPCVMFGLGGIFLEVLNDVTFRVAPLDMSDALEMLEEIRSHKILGQVRGMPEANKEKLAKMLVTLGEIGLNFQNIKEIDLNPVILRGSEPVIVDALIVLNRNE